VCHQQFTITSGQSPRMLTKLLGLLAHRQIPMLSVDACWVGDIMQVHLVVDLPDSAAELLHRQLNRLVDVETCTLACAVTA
jgi:acetolactate synthase regulatory subunit